ncbi:MAG: nickel-dependent lactate racemase [Candidatus Ranarchaeia archaeon]
MLIKMKYGKGFLEGEIPEQNILGTIDVKSDLPKFENYEKKIQLSLRNPIGSKPLQSYLKNDSKICIVVNDSTRDTPTNRLLPHLIAEIKEKDVPKENITFLFATGTHRETTSEEAKILLGENIAEEYNYVSHDYINSECSDYGLTSFKTPILINSIYAKSDIKITVSSITFHYYAGYGGGRKSVLPGIASKEAIDHNHCMLTSNDARTGNLENNPVHLDMTEAAMKVKPNIILNVIQNLNKEIAGVYSGDVNSAFQEGVKKFSSAYKIQAPKKADIVIVSGGGWPGDMNLYQSHKAIHNAQPLVKKNGVIIAIMECSEGVGHPKFEEWMKKYPDYETIKKEMNTNFELGGHKAFYLQQGIKDFDIILVSKMDKQKLENVFQLKYANSIGEALEIAFQKIGRNGSIYLFPKAKNILPVCDTE